MHQRQPASTAHVRARWRQATSLPVLLDPSLRTRNPLLRLSSAAAAANSGGRKYDGWALALAAAASAPGFSASARGYPPSPSNNRGKMIDYSGTRERFGGSRRGWGESGDPSASSRRAPAGGAGAPGASPGGNSERAQRAWRKAGSLPHQLRLLSDHHQQQQPPALLLRAPPPATTTAATRLRSPAAPAAAAAGDIWPPPLPSARFDDRSVSRRAHCTDASRRASMPRQARPATGDEEGGVWLGRRNSAESRRPGALRRTTSATGAHNIGDSSSPTAYPPAVEYLARTAKGRLLLASGVVDTFVLPTTAEAPRRSSATGGSSSSPAGVLPPPSRYLRGGASSASFTGLAGSSVSGAGSSSGLYQQRPRLLRESPTFLSQRRLLAGGAPTAAAATTDASWRRRWRPSEDAGGGVEVGAPTRSLSLTGGRNSSLAQREPALAESGGASRRGNNVGPAKSSRIVQQKE